MSDPIVAGHCDPRFQAVRDQFAQALASGFDTGASVAVEHQGEMVVNLWGGYKDREKQIPGLTTPHQCIFDNQSHHGYLLLAAG